MSRSNIPVKTSEGVQEIKARMLGLAPRIRTALLLVDGVKSVAELERLMLAAGVTPGALQLLIEKGLIRFQEETKPAVTEAKPVEVPDITDIATSSQSQPATLAPSQQIEDAPSIAEVSAAPATSADVKQVAVKPEVVEKPKMVEAQEPLVSIPMIPVPPVKSKSAPPIPVEEPDDTPDLFPEFVVAPPPALAEEPEQQLEVATLIELESILGEVTRAEMDTILGVATQLELTPTQALAPKTAVQANTGMSRLPPLAQAEYDFRMASAGQKPVIPASVLRMNLTVARAHLASALDLHLEIDGYALKQGVMASESREELEQLFRLIEGALMRKLDRSAVLRIMGVAQALLER